MKRSLLYPLAAADAQFHSEWLEEITLAEELSIDTIWCLPTAGESGSFRLGAPEMWIATAASRTQRVRLGWGIAGMLPPEKPPIRSAEKIASLDLASKGRLEIALLPEVGATFGADPDCDWQEGIRMWVEMWDAPTFSWTSDRFQVPPVDVLPKPSQRPHPALRLVGWSDLHAGLAGRAGLGFVDVSGGTDEILEMHRDVYVAARSEASPDDLVSVASFAAAVDGAAEDFVAKSLGERLEAWRTLEFDEALVQLASPSDRPTEEAGEAARGLIRSLASGIEDSDGQLH